MTVVNMVQNEMTEYLQFLSKDRGFATLPQENQVGYLKEIESFAKTKVQLFSRRFAPLNGFSDLLAAGIGLGIRIIDVHEAVHMPLLAEYEPFSCTIRLYHKKIAVVENLLKQIFPAIFTKYGLISLCLAHEFFHHLEYIATGAIGRVVTIPVKLLWMIPVQRNFARASEAAAHLFVKELLNLEYSPVFINKQLEDFYVRL
jgi:hypothetical protein